MQRNMLGGPIPGRPAWSAKEGQSGPPLAASSFLMSSGVNFGRSILIFSLFSLPVNRNGCSVRAKSLFPFWFVADPCLSARRIHQGGREGSWA